MDDKEIKLKMENEEWMHPWDIQSIIDMIDTVSVNAWYGRISDCSFRCGDQQIDLNGHCYESGWENFTTTTTEIRENGKLLFDMDSDCVGSYHLEPYVEGKFTDIKDVKKYLAEKYQDRTFEFVTERVPKVKEYFDHEHEKENLYFLTNEDGFFMKMYEAVGNPKVDEVWIEKYYPESKETARKCIPAKKQYENCEVLEC